MLDADAHLPPAPATLSSGDVTLHFVRITPGDPSRGFVPGYHFRIVTCDPDNVASMRTIERLGADFVDEVDVPPGDPHYARGSRRKLRYRWTP